jgi:hypothetical protein
MLYRFKSQATGDLVMLEKDGKRLLEVWHKDPSGPGVLLFDDMVSAVALLVESAEADVAAEAQAKADALAAGEPEPTPPQVAWRARIQPMLEMIKYCQAEAVALRWEV